MRRKPSRMPTGRLQLLRLFSTLLAIALTDTDFGEQKAQSGENASLEKSRNSLQTGGWHETSFHASL
jgi:hypothetical protein